MIHDYTPAEALRLILEKLEHAQPALHERVMEAINVGKEDVREESLGGRSRRKRFFTVKAPYSDEEAIQVTLEVLRAHLIELPLITNSAHANFLKTRVGTSKELTGVEGGKPQWRMTGQQTDDLLGQFKQLEVEVETEAATQEGRPNHRLLVVSDGSIDELQGLFGALQQLLDFRR